MYVYIYILLSRRAKYKSKVLLYLRATMEIQRHCKRLGLKVDCLRLEILS